MLESLDQYVTLLCWDLSEQGLAEIVTVSIAHQRCDMILDHVDYGLKLSDRGLPLDKILNLPGTLLCLDFIYIR
jgi:hypothetical protein